MAKQTYTTSEAAAELGISSARVRQMVLDGTLPADRFGNALVITAEGIEIARRRKTAPGPAAKTGKTTATPSPPGVQTSKEAILKSARTKRRSRKVA